MKLNLKKKVLIFSLITNLIIAIAVGGTLYKYAGELYYKSLIRSKASLAKSIALSIDGDIHRRFTGIGSAGDPEYRKLLNYMNRIRQGEDYITYLYTMNYDRRNDRLTYVIDSDINQTDVLWIATEYFGLAVSIDANRDIIIKYNEKIYKKDFNINIGPEKFTLKIAENGILYFAGKEILRVVSESPLEAVVSGKKLNTRNREIYSVLTLGNREIKIYNTFTAKGESECMPGELYVESEDVIDKCKKIINSRENSVITRDSQTSIYGKNVTTVYAVINDSRGVVNGLVVIDIFNEEVKHFKKSIMKISLIVSSIAFIFTIFLTFILAGYFISPINELTAGTQRISEGELDYTIDIRRTDELGILAASFNSMMSRLRKAHNEITAANIELSTLKDNLEVIVDERTKELKKTNSELSLALSEVKDLKGLLPICSNCKNIRDDNGYWNQIEIYISTHSQAEFTHSICPKCARLLYPEFYRDKT